MRIIRPRTLAVKDERRIEGGTSSLSEFKIFRRSCVPAPGKSAIRTLAYPKHN